MKCTGATFTDNTHQEKAASAQFRATYTGCTAFGASATVAMHTCEYELFANETASVVNWNISKLQEPLEPEKTCAKPATLTEAKNKAAEEIEITVVTGCKVWVGSQGPLSKVKYANVIGANGRKSVEAKIEIAAIQAWSNGTGLLCPTSGSQKGTYEGTSVAEGSEGTVEVK